MSRLDPEKTAMLADAAGLALPPDRLGPVTEALGQLLALAETLDELPLEGVEPVLGRPIWE
jgi:Asp-tRNA(Asn)/Glu-tRNA(Gln) amidotransferase C subunit